MPISGLKLSNVILIGINHQDTFELKFFLKEIIILELN